MTLLEHALGRYIALALALAIVAGTAMLAAPVRCGGRVVVTETTTELLDVVTFEPGTATLTGASLPTLDAVAATLRGNPSITLVEVQAHTSGVGDPAANLTLSQQRAALVLSYLSAAGVDASRLVAEGYGDTQPLDHVGSPKNERIAFLILQRAE